MQRLLEDSSHGTSKSQSSDQHDDNHLSQVVDRNSDPTNSDPPPCNRVYTWGAREGIMGAFVRKASSEDASDIRPIANVIIAELQAGSCTFRGLDIDMVEPRRRSPNESIPMEAFSGSDEPFICFVRVLSDPKKNELQERIRWGNDVAEEFTRFSKCFDYPHLLPAGTTFRYCSDITENSARIEYYSRLPTFPVSYFLLDGAVVGCMKLLYGQDHIRILAGSDERVRAFFGCNVDLGVARACILSG